LHSTGKKPKTRKTRLDHNPLESGNHGLTGFSHLIYKLFFFLASRLSLLISLDLSDSFLETLTEAEAPTIAQQAAN